MEEETLVSLPEEVMLIIGHFLDLNSILNLSATCRYLRTALNDNQLWKRFYRKQTVECIKRTTNLVEPKFRYEECETLEPLCEERINLLKQAHLMDNWRQGRYVSYQANLIDGIGFSWKNFPKVIFDNVYLFLHNACTKEISIWNIEKAPFLYTSVKLEHCAYMDWPFSIFKYHIVNDKLLVIQCNLVQVFRITLPEKELPLEYRIVVGDSVKANDVFNELSWIVGNKLILKLRSSPVVHIWDIQTGTKIRSFCTPTAGRLLSMITMDEDEDNVIFPIYTSSGVHVSCYSVSQNKYTVIFTNLRGCTPKHALRNRTCIVLFCINYRPEVSTTLFVFDTITSTIVARKTFSDQLSKTSKIIEDRLIISTETSINVLNTMSLELIISVEINDIEKIRVDYLPFVWRTLLIYSSKKGANKLLGSDNKVQLRHNVEYELLHQSYTMLIFISHVNLDVFNLEIVHLW